MPTTGVHVRAASPSSGSGRHLPRPPSIRGTRPTVVVSHRRPKSNAAAAERTLLPSALAASAPWIPIADSSPHESRSPCTAPSPAPFCALCLRTDQDHSDNLNRRRHSASACRRCLPLHTSSTRPCVCACFEAYSRRTRPRDQRLR